MKDNRFFKVLWVVLVFAAAGQLANTIFVPAMPDIAAGFEIKPEKTQAIMALYLIAFGLSQLIYGPLSDRFGRKPVMLSGIIIFIFSSTFAACAPSFTWLLVASFLQGCGIGSAGVMSRTIMRDLYSGRQLHLANSYVSMGLIFTPLLAPVIGGWLTTYWNWQACFIFLGVFGLSAWAVIVFQFRETLSAGQLNIRTSPVTSYKIILANERFQGFIICLMATFGGIAVLEATIGVLFGKTMGYSPSTVSLMFIAPIPGYLLGSWWSSRLLQNCSLGQIVARGTGLILIGSIAMLIPALGSHLNAMVILVPAFIYFMGAGMIFPTATTGAIEPFPNMAGTAGAVLGSLQNIGAGAATLISASLPLSDQLYLGYILLGLSLISLLAYTYRLSRPTNQQQELGA